ncbi:Uma2 family endonuclease, partial [Myxococcota bacterium]|nr:Uma2 family endonuclease [Myxococcota bacterium]
MSNAALRPRLPYSDYLAIDRDSLTHVELFDGEVYAMAGGTPEHALLIANVTRLVGNALLGRPCRVYAEALRVYMPQRGDAAYPDLKVICGPVVTHPDDPMAATNPVALVEVLSDGTEAFDRGGKFHRYQ